jgi:hypothetical protein
MNRIIPSTILAAIAWVTLSLSAAALEEHNPLDELKVKAVCKASPKDDKDPFEITKIGRRVKLSTIRDAAEGNNKLPRSSSSDVAVPHLVELANAIVPCRADPSKPGSSVPTSYPNGKVDRTAELRARKSACEDDTKLHQLSDQERYSKDSLAVRENFLRLFQASIHGGTKDFKPFRRKSSDNGFPTGYAPQENRFKSDIELLRYLFAEEGSAQFEIYCTAPAETPEAIKAPETPATEWIVASTPAGDAGGAWNWFKDQFGKRELKTEKGTHTELLENSQASIASLLAHRAKERIERENSGTNLEYKKASSESIQLVLTKNPDQFIKKEREGAEFGTTIPRAEDTVVDSGNVEFAADAAIGLHYRWSGSLTGAPVCATRKPDNSCSDERDMPSYKSSWDFGVTPYAGISQSSQTMVVLAENDEGVLAPKKKKFDYAKFSYGLRADYSSRLPPEPQLGSELDNAKIAYSYGLDNPGLAWGTYWEYVIDNHNLLNARKFGGYVSPPADWIPVGRSFYGRSHPVDVFIPRDKAEDTTAGSYSVWDDFWAGWFIKWNASFMAEDLDHIRYPRKLDAAPCYDSELFECDSSYVGDVWIRKKPEEIVDGAVYGTDLSFALSRFELHGLGKDDLFVELKANYIYRQEFDRSNSADLWNLSLKFQDPTSTESRYWKLEYIVGEDYLTGNEEEKLSFKIVLAN